MKATVKIENKELWAACSLLKNGCGCRNKDFKQLCEHTIKNGAIQLSTRGSASSWIASVALGQGYEKP